MATIKTFRDYSEAVNFYEKAPVANGRPELHYDPEFNHYEVIFWDK